MYLVPEEDAESLDPKINVLSLGLHALPSNNHLHKTTILKWQPLIYQHLLNLQYNATDDYITINFPQLQFVVYID